jgi:putative spermidine/putrescine transport system substrate-binding protein
VISEEYQGQAAAAPYFFGPTNRKVEAPETARPYLLANEAEFAATLQIDWMKASKQRASATDRFNREFSR